MSDSYLLHSSLCTSINYNQGTPVLNHWHCDCKSGQFKLFAILRTFRSPEATLNLLNPNFWE